MKNDFYNKIDAYLKNMLTEAEKADFKSALKNDPDLGYETEIRRLEWEAIYLIREKSVREKLEALQIEELAEAAEADEIEERRVVVMNQNKSRSFMFAAAGLLILIGVGAWLFMNQKIYSDSQLLAEFGEMPEEYFSQTKGESTDRPEIKEIFQLLYEKKSDAALIQLQEFSTDSDWNGEYLKLLTAHIFLQKAIEKKEEKLARKALLLFQETGIETQIIERRQEAQWFELLALIAAGEKESPAFKNLLEQIAKDVNHSYQRDAILLKKRLAM